MPEDLGDEGMTEGVDTIACHTSTKERQPQAMSELSHHQPKISHPMLRVIVSRLKAKAEELLAEEQAAIRPGWSTVEQLLNLSLIHI